MKDENAGPDAGPVDQPLQAFARIYDENIDTVYRYVNGPGAEYWGAEAGVAVRFAQDWELAATAAWLEGTDELLVPGSITGRILPEGAKSDTASVSGTAVLASLRRRHYTERMGVFRSLPRLAAIAARIRSTLGLRMKSASRPTRATAFRPSSNTAARALQAS